MTIRHVTSEAKIHHLPVFGPFEALHDKINDLRIAIDFDKWWVWLSKAAYDRLAALTTITALCHAFDSSSQGFMLHLTLPLKMVFYIATVVLAFGRVWKRKQRCTSSRGIQHRLVLGRGIGARLLGMATANEYSEWIERQLSGLEMDIKLFLMFEIAASTPDSLENKQLPTPSESFDGGPTNHLDGWRRGLKLCI